MQTNYLLSLSICQPSSPREKASTSSAAEQPEASRAGKVEVFSKAKTFEDLGIIHRMVSSVISDSKPDKSNAHKPCGTGEFYIN